MNRITASQHRYAHMHLLLIPDEMMIRWKVVNASVLFENGVQFKQHWSVCYIFSAGFQTRSESQTLCCACVCLCTCVLHKLVSMSLLRPMWFRLLLNWPGEMRAHGFCGYQHRAQTCCLTRWDVVFVFWLSAKQTTDFYIPSPPSFLSFHFHFLLIFIFIFNNTPLPSLAFMQRTQLRMVLSSPWQPWLPCEKGGMCAARQGSEWKQSFIHEHSLLSFTVTGVWFTSDFWVLCYNHHRCCITATLLHSSVCAVCWKV